MLATGKNEVFMTILPPQYVTFTGTVSVDIVATAMGLADLERDVIERCCRRRRGAVVSKCTRERAWRGKLDAWWGSVQGSQARIPVIHLISCCCQHPNSGMYPVITLFNQYTMSNPGVCSRILGLIIYLSSCIKWL
jgi:hypothetical protein